MHTIYLNKALDQKSVHLIILTFINFKDLSRSAETCPFHFQLMYYMSYLCFRNAVNQCGFCLNMYLCTWKELRPVNTQEVLRDWAFVWTQLSRWKIRSQDLNITAAYESRIKLIKSDATQLPRRLPPHINSSSRLTDLTSYKPEITSTEVSKACIA